jgi:DNA mismatch repair protein MutS2
MEETKRGNIARAHAEEVLELPKILDLLAEYCKTEPAKAKARSIKPLNDIGDVEYELKRVEKVYKYGDPVDFFIPFEPGFLTTASTVHAYLSIDNFCSLKDFINHMHTLKNRFRNTAVHEFFAPFGEYGEIRELIEKKIDDDRQIRDNASPALAKIRSRKRGLRDQINRTLKDLLQDRSYLFSDLNIVERNGRHVLPVKSGYKKELPGIVHSYSNSGETIFIEPMGITEYSAELGEISEREKEEIELILRSMTDSVRIRSEDLERDLERIVNLDLLFAKAAYARRLNATMPQFGDHVTILNGVHPILRYLRNNVVPLNLKMDKERRVLLISGPNAGGKTVVLKTVGMLVLMAKCGFFIPADEGTIFPFFGDVFADIGDEQSLESSLSTFAAHIRQIVEGLESDRKNNLVLLDELMNQTSVEEGSALASAVMEEFANRGDLLMATTHNENLKIYASKRPDMINAGMEYTDKPTYRLIVGIPQPSNAIKLAVQMGMGKTITDRALSYMDREILSIDELFKDLSRELTDVQKEREAIAREKIEYETKLADLKVRKKKELDELKEQYRREIVQAKRSVDRLIKTLKKEGAKPEKVKEAKAFFEAKVGALSEADRIQAEPYYPVIGEIVRIRELKRAGQVVAKRQGKFKVSLDNIFYWVEPREIEPASEAVKQ